MPMNHDQACHRAAVLLHSCLPVMYGNIQYRMPMKVKVTAVPTVKWKWPGTQAVL